MRIAQIATAAIVVVLILTVGFGAALILLALLAALYLVAAIATPIVLHAKGQAHEKPVVQAMAPDDASIPESARAALRAHRDALLELGFEARDMIHQPAGAAPIAYLALYRHTASSARALSRVLLKPGKGALVVQSADVEFEMRYDNGTTAELSNVTGPVPGIEHFPGMIGQMPQLREVAPLFGYFLKLVAQYERESGLSAQARVPLPDDATLAKLYYEQLERAFAIQHRVGLLKPTGTPGIWRPTWRLAFMMAAATISPGLEFVRRRSLARGDRLRRDLDGDAIRTPAERIGRRTGWTMLLVGTPLSVIAVLMSFPGSSIAFLGMMIAGWLTRRRGKDPGWGSIVLGGVAAMLLLGLPIAVPYKYPLGIPPQPMSEMLMGVGVFLLPMVLLILAAVLMVEGFRAAAT